VLKLIYHLSILFSESCGSGPDPKGGPKLVTVSEEKYKSEGKKKSSVIQIGFKILCFFSFAMFIVGGCIVIDDKAGGSE